MRWTFLQKAQDQSLEVVNAVFVARDEAAGFLRPAVQALLHGLATGRVIALHAIGKINPPSLLVLLL